MKTKQGLAGVPLYSDRFPFSQNSRVAMGLELVRVYAFVFISTFDFLLMFYNRELLVF